MLTGFAGTILALLLLAVALKLLNPLPSRDAIAADLPLPAVASPLADELDRLAAEHDGETGLIMLQDGIGAFAMRLAMVRNATRSVDAQYYIWEEDLAGRMLLQEIIAAADRGVRVRLLIDDNPTAGLDPMWAAITSHPRIHVRLFNPMMIRSARPLNYLFDFPRLNRRMHNKSLTVDGAATLVGGRNIGDVYFGATDDRLFIDLDTVAFGNVVPDVVVEFEDYWASESAYPAELILDAPEPSAIESYRAPQFEDAQLAVDYRAATDEALAKLALDQPDKILTWATVRLYADDPAKGLGKAPDDELLATQLAPAIEGAQQRFDMVSGYFVPSTFGTELLTGIARRGVTTRVVTNSLQVTDVAIVQAGYSPSRKPLLAAGVSLHEARPREQRADFHTRELGSVRFSGGGESVHAKTFAIDSRHFFVGSFNFDPRSALLNCEMGFLIDSLEISQAFIAKLDEEVPELSYTLALEDADDITWTYREGGEARTVTTEPGTTMFDRGLIWALSKLPITWML